MASRGAGKEVAAPKNLMKRGSGSTCDSAGLVGKPHARVARHSDQSLSGRQFVVDGLNGMQVEVVLDEWQLNVETLKCKVEHELGKRLSREDSAKLAHTTIDLLVDGRLCGKCTDLTNIGGVRISFVRREMTEEEYDKNCEDQAFRGFLSDVSLTDEQFRSLDDHEIDSLLGPFYDT